MSRGERASDPAATSRYAEKAAGFLRAAVAALDGGDWTVAVSNAVHSGISAVDAYMVKHHGVRSASPDHRAQVRLLRRHGGPAAEEQAGHLERLLARKSKAEYGDRLSTEKEARDAVTRAQRLVDWMRAEGKGARR